LSSTAGFWISTDDPTLRVEIVPASTIGLVFGGKSGGTFAPSRPPKVPNPWNRSETADQDDEPAEHHPYRIELSIDSLPNHLLIEPIPVAIDPVGDSAFTAFVRGLDTSATGHSVAEALVLLKERIEFVYDDLNKRAQLSIEEKTTLQMLHTYIMPPTKRPDWVY
jgi:hypothetical protein